MNDRLATATIPDEKKANPPSTNQLEQKSSPSKLFKLSISAISEALDIYIQNRSVRRKVVGDHEDIKKLRQFYNSLTEQKVVHLNSDQIYELIELIRGTTPRQYPFELTARELTFHILKKNFVWDSVILGIDQLRKFNLINPNNVSRLAYSAKHIEFHFMPILEALNTIHLANQHNLDLLFNLAENSSTLEYLNANTIPNAIKLLSDKGFANQENINLFFRNPHDAGFIANSIIKLHELKLDKNLPEIMRSSFLAELAYIITKIPFPITQEIINKLLQRQEHSPQFNSAMLNLNWALKLTQEDLNVFFKYPNCAVSYVAIINTLHSANPSLNTPANLATLRFYAANANQIREQLKQTPQITQEIFDNCIKQVRQNMKFSFMLGTHPNEKKREDCNPSHIWKFFGAKNGAPNEPHGDLKPLKFILQFL